jgi:hypothetical protein
MPLSEVPYMKAITIGYINAISKVNFPIAKRTGLINALFPKLKWPRKTINMIIAQDIE